MEFIVEVLLMLVLRYPGAFVISLFSKRTSKQILDEDGEIAAMLGLLLMGCVIVAVVNADKFLSTSPATP